MSYRQLPTFQIDVEQRNYYGDHEVRINDQLVGYRRYDGSDKMEVEEEVANALALMLRGFLRYEETPSCPEVGPNW